MNDRSYKALHLAIESNDQKQLIALLQQPVALNILRNGQAPLHKAVILGHGNIVKILIEYGADVHLRDQQGFYPLHWAAHLGHLAVCNRLVSAVAKVQLVNANGDSPLHLAAAAGNTKVVRTLLAAGAVLSQKNQQGNTAIALACINSQLGVLKSIPYSTSLFKLKNNRQNSPLLLALIALQKAQIAEWSVTKKETGSSLVYRIRRGRIYQSTTLPRCRCTARQRLSIKNQKRLFDQPWFPLQQRNFLKHETLLHYLLKQTVLVLDPNSRGLDPLHIACIIGDGKILKALFDRGAIYSPANGVVNALHLVCGAGRLDGLNAFLKVNPNIEANLMDVNGWTALHYLADSGGSIAMLQLLLSKGADPRIKSNKASANFEAGITAAKIALAQNNLDLAIALDSK